MGLSQTFLNDVTTIQQQTVNLAHLKDKTILVTGATGQIGSFLVQVLSEIDMREDLNLKIIAVGRNETKFLQKFSQFVSRKNIVFVQQDFNDELNWQFSVNYIIHAASNAEPKAYAEDPVGTMNSNYISTLHILDYAREKQVDKVVYISTGEVYGEITSEEPLIETDSGYLDSMQVRSCYPVSKRATETLCVSFKQQFGVDISIARLAHIFGPNFSQTDSRIASQFLNEANQENDLIMYSEGKQIRSYTYISDCISGILSVLLAGISGEAYNVANTNNAISLHDFCQCIAKNAGVHLQIVVANEEEEKLKTPINHAILSDTKLKALGWQPIVSVERGITQTLATLKGR